jgi:hypothetical protein
MAGSGHCTRRGVAVAGLPTAQLRRDSGQNDRGGWALALLHQTLDGETERGVLIEEELSLVAVLGVEVDTQLQSEGRLLGLVP